jgi:hypothetical protein
MHWKKCKHPKSSQNELAPPTHTMWGWFMEGGHEMKCFSIGLLSHTSTMVRFFL